MLKNTSKAGMLKLVQSKTSVFRVPELLIFRTSDYLDSPSNVVQEVQATFSERPLVIRSSAVDEDCSQYARAGEYDSILNISATDPEAICKGIETVLASYARQGKQKANDEFFVQEFLKNTVMSGVVFTHDLNTGAPYYVINYDDVSGLTNTVTSGGGEYSNRTLYVHRAATHALRSKRFKSVIQAVQNLEKLVGSQFLDVEFALDEDLTPYLLQVRAITTMPNWNRAVSRRIDAALAGIQRFVHTRLQPMVGVYGNTTVLGQMPDWNPAEMLGRAPRALAVSLYKTLITDHPWRKGRELMGYAVPTGQPLMVLLAGQPFIDTRLSFHSYLPAGLADETSEKLVNTWVERLRVHPELHDKVEFDVAITTYSFDIDEKIEALIGDSLDETEKLEFKNTLRKQTIELVTGKGQGSIDEALKRVARLAEKQTELKDSPSGKLIAALVPMTSDCIRLGTIPFSILARHGFIAQTILLSLVRHGMLTVADVQNFQSSVQTVASMLVRDMRQLQTGSLSREDFMASYGHLRPGTYDILSQRYDQMPDFAATDTQSHPEQATGAFEFSAAQKNSVDQLLKDEGFDGLDCGGLFDYIRAAIVGREFGKFVFTRSVSDMLELIAGFGEQHGLSRDEMSHIPMGDLHEIITQSDDSSIEERLRGIAEQNAEKHVLSVAIRLPQVLFDEAGVHVIPFQVCQPNFITQKNITAACVRLVAGETPPDLDGKVVLIENADPGFDWIFAQQIGGLITKYGGANSHMAIRCAEFGIPAAIGCGEQRFDVFANASQLLLDCAAGLIEPLH